MAACTAAAVAGSSTWAALSATTRRDSDAATCSSSMSALPAARRWGLAWRARTSLATSCALQLGRRSLRLTTQTEAPSSSVIMPSSSMTTSASPMGAAASTSAMVDGELGFWSNGRSSIGCLKPLAVNSRQRQRRRADVLEQVGELRETTKQTRGRLGGGGSATARREGEQRGLARASSDDNQGSNLEEEELDEEDLRTGLNEVSNKAIRVMLSGDIQALQEMKDEVNYIGEYLTQEKQWDAARFMLVLLGLLEKKVVDEADQLEGIYKEAYEKIGRVIDDSGWALARPDKDLPGEAMIDDELIPPVLQTPY